MGENILQTDIHRHVPLNGGNHPHGFQAVAAKIEKIIVNADQRIIQNLPPDTGDPGLDIVLGRKKWRAGCRGYLHGVGQRLFIDLAVRCQGQAFHLHKI